MSFLDDTIVTAKEWLDVASQKTAEAVEVQKIRLAIAKKKSELSKAFETLGRTYYESQSGEIDGDLLSVLCRDVEGLQEELMQLKDRLYDTRNCRVCPGCGKKNPEGSGFCNGCGKTL